MHAPASFERRSRQTRGTRAAAREEKRASPVSRLQSRAWSFACLGRFARRTKRYNYFAKDTITLNDLIDPYGFAPPLKKPSCVISAPTAMLSLYQKPKSNRRPPLPSHWQLLQSTRKYKKNEQNHSICYVSCSINKALWITSYQLTARSYIG